MDRRQVLRKAAPRITLVLREPKASGGRAEGEALAARVDVEAVAIDQVVRVLRQSFAEHGERLAAIAGARHHQLRIDRDAAFVLHRRHEPGGIGVFRMHRDREAELRRRDRADLREARRAVDRAEYAVMVLRPEHVGFEAHCASRCTSWMLGLSRCSGGMNSAYMPLPASCQLAPPSALRHVPPHEMAMVICLPLRQTEWMPGWS